MLTVPGLVLASQSEWRLKLLAQIGIQPEQVVVHGIDEGVQKGELAREYCKRVAIAKTEDVFSKMPDKVILGADTVASLGRRIFTKPRDASEAKAWLRMFSGRRHKVYTTVCLCAPGVPTRHKIVESALKFKRLSPRDVEWHTESGDWQGKAGGYSVNGLAAAFIAWISGSHSAVAGLPLYETMLLLDNYIRVVSKTH